MNKNVTMDIINDSWIVDNRGNKNSVDPQKPYAWMVEKECTISGKIENTGVIFLTNRECPFHCLMCDLWKNTTDISVPVGAIPNQIEWALAQMPEVKHLKLYNSGNFFDKKAIPQEDYARIASLVAGFETLIIESHPKLIGEECLRFRDMIIPQLQIAIGLETVHPGVLQKLNKQMTLEDFSNSVSYLTQNGILSRAFVLLRPPFLSESEGVYWAKASIDFAYHVGVECCTVIPVRTGNGVMDLLLEKGDFTLPDIHSLETVVAYGIGINAGRIFADVWDLNLFSNCQKCIDRRTDRLIAMNLSQIIVSPVTCICDFNNTKNLYEPYYQ